ncbi:MAG: 16S rRNA (guanine(527)-N(7))-methyltransferase RsmG [Phycisphaerae bacterium]|nr:16S rRNA (guanine(527)-N(7))-methyltransferase RsmG [Phycisphaerae bacterium]
MDRLEPTDPFLQACDALDVRPAPAQVEQLGAYLHLLLETNKQFNLTGIREPEAAWMRHILDSLTFVPFLGDATAVIDVGSGGGLPGIPLAIVRPDLRITLLEATGKKARFLESACGQLGLEQVAVVCDRAETAAHDPALRGRFDLAVARAVGPMSVALELTLPFLSVGGRLLAAKGKRAEGELREAGDTLMLLGAGDVEVYDAMPGLDDEAVMVVVRQDRPMPGRFPRRPGMPKQQPLG